MNYLVIIPMGNDSYLVQWMNEIQYNALKTAKAIDDSATVYETEQTTAQTAQSGILGMKSTNEIEQYIKDNTSVITHIEGPPFDDGTGDTD